VSPETIVADLRRRDFTINAIAIRLDGRHFGEVLDPLGGRDDLRGKRINVLHKRSFVDDPTRMYRAVRYEQRLGFRIGRATLALLREGGSWVPAVSGQRLRRELDLILMEKPKAASLRRLSKLGLLRPIHRALPADPRCLRRLGSWYAHDDAQALLRPASNELWLTWMQWLMDVRPAALRAIGHRLVLDRKEMESILAAAELYRTARTWVHWRPSELTGQLDGIPQIAVDAVHAVLPQGKARRMLGQYLHSWRHIRTHASGRDLHDRGLTPGPRYRSILEALRAAWIDGAVQNANEESLLLERLIGRAPARARRNRGNGRVRSALKR
jgi:tRNA nucleotidyltransferase (CCA-adding enzyme)